MALLQDRLPKRPFFKVTVRVARFLNRNDNSIINVLNNLSRFEGALMVYLVQRKVLENEYDLYFEQYNLIENKSIRSNELTGSYFIGLCVPNVLKK